MLGHIERGGLRIAAPKLVFHGGAADACRRLRRGNDKLQAISVSDGSNRAAAVSCAVALLTLVPVAMHQLGVVRHLPDPPGALFDSDAITESKAAHPMGIPDGLLGLASYGATLALLLAGRRNRTARGLLGLKLKADASVAAANVVRQVVSFHRICSWCTATAVATGAVVYFGEKSLRT